MFLVNCFNNFQTNLAVMLSQYLSISATDLVSRVKHLSFFLSAGQIFNFHFTAFYGLSGGWEGPFLVASQSFNRSIVHSAMATGRGYAKGDGKTKKGTLPQQLPMPSTSTTASSSSSEPMQTQQQQVASTPPTSITTGSQNVSLQGTSVLGSTHIGTAPSNWFISTIPEDAPAARTAEPVAVFTDDDLFDEPDWVPPIHVQIPADWPPLPDTSSSSGSSYVY